MLPSAVASWVRPHTFTYFDITDALRLYIYTQYNMASDSALTEPVTEPCWSRAPRRVLKSRISIFHLQITRVLRPTVFRFSVHACRNALIAMCMSLLQEACSLALGRGLWVCNCISVCVSVCAFARV